MRPSSFEYHKATSLEHALELLARFGEGGRPLAGGQSLVPMMNLRLARPNHLVDINHLPLASIVFNPPVMRVGGLVRHEQYFANPHIKAHFPAFHDAVHCIGHPTIRRRGTIGGSISHADPTAELPAMAVLYDAVIVASSQAGERRIRATDFFRGAYVTALEPGEMVTAIEFPIPPANSTGSFIELGERKGDFAIAGMGVSIEFDRETIGKAAVVCSGADLKPVRAREVEQHLVGRSLRSPDSAGAGKAYAAVVEPAGDHLASTDYRKNLIGELTRRAIDAACARALGKS